MQVAQPSRSFALAMVLLIATLLAARPMGLGLDDENYLEYFNGAQEILSRYEGLSYVFNEPLWLLLCYSANALLGDEGALRFVIFASSAFAGVGVARMNRWSLLPIVLYFALPTSLKNHVDHLRQGFALGLYVFLFTAEGRWRTLRFATPLVHASFWVVIVIDVLLARYYDRHPERTRVDALKILLVSAGVSVALSFGLAQVAAALGFRQADVYDFLASEGSGAAFLSWLVLLPVLFALANRQYFGPFAAFLGFYLGGYYFSPVAARIFENSYFLLCSSAPTASRSKRLVFWAILIAMCIALGFTGSLYPRLLGMSAD
ncbi:EpsG family protein [Methylibium rhizosphaerae]|uniref:EpsG family protein n=1 Tax=Methylibium rhizosphaerae TaxID=2570323 RepID=UPI0011273367|nr:EpsG family protein [Methylibium rhizosphaerae]